MRVLIALEIGGSLNAADWRISSARWEAGLQADWTREADDWCQDGEKEQHAQRSQPAKIRQTLSGRFVVSVLDYHSISTNNLGGVIICWLGKLKAKLRRVLTAVEAQGSPEGGPDQPTLRIRPPLDTHCSPVHSC